MDGELFYQVLLSELQAREGEPAAAFARMLGAARRTGSSELYERAVEIGAQSQSPESALVAARAWQQAQPQARGAWQAQARILLGLNRVSEAQEPMRRLLALTDAHDRVALVHGMARALSRTSDKSLAAQVLQRVTADVVAQGGEVAATCWDAIGQLRLQAGDSTGARAALTKAVAADPHAQGTAELTVALLQAGDRTPQPELEAVLVTYLDQPKASPTLRMEYARLLLQTRRWAAAQTQLGRITDDAPTLPHPWLVLGSLHLQQGRLVAAEQSLRRYIDLAGTGTAHAPDNPRAVAQAYQLLGQIAQERGDWDQAQHWLDSAVAFDDSLSLQLRRALVLGRRGQLEAARALIHGLSEANADDARAKVSTEIQLLREARQFAAAYELLARASAEQPQDIDLLYELGMLAERLGRFDEMEGLMRRVMAGRPDSPMAYNALGYGLAERNQRLDEARQLVMKALELAPGDPFISDSLGWVEFRAGRLDDAARILRKAFEARPDAEIAAHLGEVLWALQQTDAARAVWREGQQINADNETLRETLKRLGVGL